MPDALLKPELIYIVDDDEVHRSSLRRILQLNGYSVQDFDSAEAFFATPRLRRPAVLLLDMRMPEKSGLAIQSHLSELQENIPIIFLSGQSFPQEIIASLKGGAFDFILKPFEIDALLASIKKALELDHSRHNELNEQSDLAQKFNSLTNREKEVYALINEGLLNIEIAEKLAITPRTVKAHKSQIMSKMSADSPQALLKMWIDFHSNPKLNGG